MSHHQCGENYSPVISCALTMLEPKIFILFLPLLLLAAEASSEIGPFHRTQQASIRTPFISPSVVESIPSQTESHHHVYEDGRYTGTRPNHGSHSSNAPAKVRSSKPNTPRPEWKLSNAAWSTWSPPNVSTDSPVDIPTTSQYNKPELYQPPPPVTPIPIEKSNVQIDTANSDRDLKKSSTDIPVEIKTAITLLPDTQRHPVYVQERLMETGPYHRPQRSSNPWQSHVLSDDSFEELRASSQPVYMGYKRAPPKATVESQLSHFSCPQPHGYFKHAHKCDEYVECKNYVPLKFTCPGGLHFNPNVQWTEYPCDRPSKVECVKETTPRPTTLPPATTHAPKEVPTPRPNNLQPGYMCSEPHGYFQLTHSCGEYVECKNYVPILFTCPAGLIFNPLAKWIEYPCEHPSKVQCNKEPGYEVSPTPIPPPTTRPPPTTTTTRRPPPPTTRSPPPPPTTRRPPPPTRPPPLTWPPPPTRPPTPPTTRPPPPPPPTTRRPPPPPPTRPTTPPTTRRPPPPPTTRRPPPPPTTRRPPPPPTTRRPPPPPPTTRRPTPPPTTTRRPPPPTTRRPTPPPTTTRRPTPPPTTTRSPPPPRPLPPPPTTAPPPVTTLGPNHICPNQHGYFKITDECGKYVECKNYAPLMFTCPAGLHFNPFAKWIEYPCVHPSKVQCNPEPEMTYRPSTVPPTTAAPVVTTPHPGRQVSDFKCPQSHGYFEHADSCSEYIECKNHEPLFYACPAGLHFNSLVNWIDYPCDQPSKVQCNKQSVVTNQPITYKPHIAVTPRTITAVTPYIPHVKTQMPISYPPQRSSHQLDDYYCEESNAYFSVASKCDVYIECKSYIAVQHFCPVGLHFNSKVQWPNYPCDYPSKAQCNDGQIIHHSPQLTYDIKSKLTELGPHKAVKETSWPLQSGIETLQIQQPAVETRHKSRPSVETHQRQRLEIGENRPQRPAVVSPWPQQTVEQTIRPQRPVAASQRIQRPPVERHQTQRLEEVTPRPQRLPVEIRHKQRPAVETSETQISVVETSQTQRPAVETYQTQRLDEITTRPQRLAVETRQTQSSAVETHQTQRREVVTKRPQRATTQRTPMITSRYSTTIKPYTPRYRTQMTVEPISINLNQLFDYTCPESNGFYEVSSQCDVYVECKSNIAIQHSCPDGLLFNSEAHWPDYPCGYPTEVKCKSGDAVQIANPTAECPHRDGFFPAGTDDCGKYIVCHAGVAILEQCPAGLVFNFEKDVCDWPINVPQCNKPRALESFVCPATQNGENGFIRKYRYGRSCKEFIACQEEQPRLLSCDGGLYFDEKTESCVDSELVADCDELL